MKEWLRKSLVCFIEHFDFSSTGEFQARQWFRNNVNSSRNENTFINICKSMGLISTKYFCFDCCDTGCPTGGIGYSCDRCAIGCCLCKEENPNIRK